MGSDKACGKCSPIAHGSMVLHQHEEGIGRSVPYFPFNFSVYRLHCFCLSGVGLWGRKPSYCLEEDYFNSIMPICLPSPGLLGKIGCGKIVFSLLFSHFFTQLFPDHHKKFPTPFVFRLFHLWNADLLACQGYSVGSIRCAERYLQAKAGISFLSFLNHNLTLTSGVGRGSPLYSVSASHPVVTTSDHGDADDVTGSKEAGSHRDPLKVSCNRD